MFHFKWYETAEKQEIINHQKCCQIFKWFIRNSKTKKFLLEYLLVFTHRSKLICSVFIEMNSLTWEVEWHFNCFKFYSGSCSSVLSPGTTSSCNFIGSIMSIMHNWWNELSWHPGPFIPKIQSELLPSNNVHIEWRRRNIQSRKSNKEIVKPSLIATGPNTNPAAHSSRAVRVSEWTHNAVVMGVIKWNWSKASSNSQDSVLVYQDCTQWYCQNWENPYVCGHDLMWLRPVLAPWRRSDPPLYHQLYFALEQHPHEKPDSPLSLYKCLYCQLT